MRRGAGIAIQSNRVIRVELHFRIVVRWSEPKQLPDSGEYALSVKIIINADEAIDAANISSRRICEVDGSDLDPIYKCSLWWGRQINHSRDHILISRKG